MRKILCLMGLVPLGLVPLAMLAGPAHADGAAATIARFGLTGAWSSACTSSTTTAQPEFRVIFGEQSAGAATFTTIDWSGGLKTTVRSAVLGVAPVAGHWLKLTLRITGGDRDGGPLPSPATNIFDQLIEASGYDHIRLVNAVPQILGRCS